MYYLYILYSVTFDKFYIGISEDPDRRLSEHNNTFTSKYRPWKLSLSFEIGPDLSKALKVEKKVKKQKNRSIYYKLLEPEFRKAFLSSAG